MPIPSSDLMLNSDGSIYHLNLLPGELAETIILVGDPDRVPRVSAHFDHIEVKKRKREFVTHTGHINGKRLSVLSTGIGTGNIDIVINEIDTLFNIDFATRQQKPSITHLNLIRLGTSGALPPDLAVDQFLVSHYAIGFDGLMLYYNNQPDAGEKQLLSGIQQHFKHLPTIAGAYAARGSAKLLALFKDTCETGITVTMGGFYGPQYRSLRAPESDNDFFEKLPSFNHDGQVVTNIEMETAAIYGLGRLLGHECCSINALIDNQTTHTVSNDIPKLIDNMIAMALEKIITVC